MLNFEKMTEKKNRLDALRPLSVEQVSILEDWFRTELTHTSNAIEGNTLSHSETQLVLQMGVTIKGKSVVEHLEVTNHADALDWVKEQIRRKPSSLEKRDILFLHSLVLKKIDPMNAGRYRNELVEISDSDVKLPHPMELNNLMADVLDWLGEDHDDIHPVELAAQAHYKLVRIHSFIDGNGRTSRLLMNMILMMFGYPPAIIKKDDRDLYMASLEKAHKDNDLNDFIKFIADAVEYSLDIYLQSFDKSS